MSWAAFDVAGVSIVDVEDKAPWQDAVQPIIDQYSQEHGALIDAIRSEQ